MANTFVTNKKTDLVALRAAEAAAYLTVGSKAYFKDQLEGKRNGTSYEFVIREFFINMLKVWTCLIMSATLSNVRSRRTLSWATS